MNRIADYLDIPSLVQFLASVALQLSGYTSKSLTIAVTFIIFVLVMIGIGANLRLPILPVLLITVGVLNIWTGYLLLPSNIKFPWNQQSTSSVPSPSSVQVPITPITPTNPVEELYHPPIDPFATPIPVPSSELGGSTITPYSLMELYASGSMTAHSDRLVQPHIGDWLTSTFVVADVRIRENGTSSVSFKYQLLPFKPFTFPTPRGGSLVFDKNWRHRVETLAKGQIITVRGKIDEITERYVDLRNCELVEANAPK